MRLVLLSLVVLGSALTVWADSENYNEVIDGNNISETKETDLEEEAKENEEKQLRYFGLSSFFSPGSPSDASLGRQDNENDNNNDNDNNEITSKVQQMSTLAAVFSGIAAILAISGPFALGLVVGLFLKGSFGGGHHGGYHHPLQISYSAPPVHEPSYNYVSPPIYDDKKSYGSYSHGKGSSHYRRSDMTNILSFERR